MASEDQTAENHQLSLFLANQNSITTHFNTELHQISGCAPLYVASLPYQACPCRG